MNNINSLNGNNSGCINNDDTLEKLYFVSNNVLLDFLEIFRLDTLSDSCV